MAKKEKKIIYYKDELNDDFSDLGLKRPKLDEDFKFIRSKNPIYTFFAGWLFYLVAKPLFYTINFFRGIRYHNVKKLKKFKKVGCFIYQNHTTFYDMWTVTACVVRGKRTNVIGFSDTTSMKFVHFFARQLGYIPIPDSFRTTINFQKALDYYINDKHQNILIFPERHVWPLYTKIRPYNSASFHYPAKLKAPVIPITTTYRKRKLFKKPGIDIWVGDAVYPKEELSLKENKEFLRDECYKQMCEISLNTPQEEYYIYKKQED